MPGESFTNVTEGSGKKLHTYQRLVGANNVEDEFVLPGEYPYPTYSVVTASQVATATANSHLLQIMAGTTLNVRIRSITLWQSLPPASVTGVEIDVVRVTTAGTGGTGLTARPYDVSDPAAGAQPMTLPTVKGTEGAQLLTNIAWFGTVAVPLRQPMIEWKQIPNAKPIMIPAGATNGIVIKNVPALAGASVFIQVELVETPY